MGFILFCFFSQVIIASILAGRTESIPTSPCSRLVGWGGSERKVLAGRFSNLLKVVCKASHEKHLALMHYP